MGGEEREKNWQGRMGFPLSGEVLMKPGEGKIDVGGQNPTQKEGENKRIRTYRLFEFSRSGKIYRRSIARPWKGFVQKKVSYIKRGETSTGASPLREKARDEVLNAHVGGTLTVSQTTIFLRVR